MFDKEELLANLEKTVGVYPDQLDPEAMREAELLAYVALLPKDFDTRLRYLQKSYMRNRLLDMLGG